MEPMKIIIPKTQKEIEELKKLDKEGKLGKGGSYPTKDQFDRISIEEVNKGYKK